MASIIELPYWRIRSGCFDVWHQWQVRRRFYRDRRFAQLDRAILDLPNPFKNKKAFPYGETPLLVMQQIADRFGITSADTVYDLGCGRGRAAFFLSWYTGCRVYGIDWTPQFIANATALARAFNVRDVEFSCGNFLEADLSRATFVFIYGTLIDETALLKKLPPHAKIASVSAPLGGLSPSNAISTRFPWGKTEVYCTES